MRIFSARLSVGCTKDYDADRELDVAVRELLPAFDDPHVFPSRCLLDNPPCFCPRLVHRRLEYLEDVRFGQAFDGALSEVRSMPSEQGHFIGRAIRRI